MLKFSVVAAAAAVCDGEELVLEFTRSVEAENTDPCTLASLVDEFLKTLETLFQEGHIWRADNKHTWTQVVIDQMKEAKKDFLPRGLNEELRECHAAWDPRLPKQCLSMFFRMVLLFRAAMPMSP